MRVLLLEIIYINCYTFSPAIMPTRSDVATVQRDLAALAEQIIRALPAFLRPKSV